MLSLSARQKIIYQQVFENGLRGIILLLACVFCKQLYAEPSINPHSMDFTKSVEHSHCLSCHKKTPSRMKMQSGKHVIPDMKNYVKNSTDMCTSCHGEDDSSHIVGMTPDYKVPADLPLDKNNRMTCLTCHYTHGSLKTDKPMASTSLMDHLFNRNRLSKSYVLRRNNAYGDLCLACHSE